MSHCTRAKAVAVEPCKTPLRYEKYDALNGVAIKGNYYVLYKLNWLHQILINIKL